MEFLRLFGEPHFVVDKSPNEALTCLERHFKVKNDQDNVPQVRIPALVGVVTNDFPKNPYPRRYKNRFSCDTSYKKLILN